MKWKNTYYNSNTILPVRLATDASPYGIDAEHLHVLVDRTECPIAFAYRAFTKAEKDTLK